MTDFKSALKTTAITLAVIWALNQTNITRPLVQRALTGQ
jgi:hypothetical protein